MTQYNDKSGKDNQNSSDKNRPEQGQKYQQDPKGQKGQKDPKGQQGRDSRGQSDRSKDSFDEHGKNEEQGRNSPRR